MKYTHANFPHQEENEPLEFWKQRVLRWKLGQEAELREMRKKAVRTNIGFLYDNEPIKEILGE